MTDRCCINYDLSMHVRLIGLVGWLINVHEGMSTKVMIPSAIGGHSQAPTQ